MFDVWQALCEHGVERYVQFDLGLYPNHDYYTGVVMEGYVDRLGQRICYGGRYDHLLAKFGRPLPATGCVLHLERLQDAVEVSAPTRDLIALSYEPACRADALGFARDLRSRGYQVATTLYLADEDSAKGLKGAPEELGGSGTPGRYPAAPVAPRGVSRSAVIWDRSGPTLQGDALLAEMFAQFQDRRPLPC
jgi:ATP phosphoribosyltransferase regulatory subunit